MNWPFSQLYYPGFNGIYKNISLNLLDLKIKWNEAQNTDVHSDKSLEKIIEEIPGMDSAKIDGIVRRIKEVREDHQNIIEK